MHGTQQKNWVSKLLLKLVNLFLLISIFSFLNYAVNTQDHTYKKIFRISQEQVSSSLNSVVSQCSKIKDCKLLPGDILLRRYITKRTYLIDKLANPYFTHSAFYIGNDTLVEAIGTEKNSEDDITLATLSKSDWFNSDVTNFVIFRPKNYNSKLEQIKFNLIEIANDKEYIFGLPRPGRKSATCADLIFAELSKARIINDELSKQKIITPDYLFWIVVNESETFEIVGYNIEK